MEGHFTFGMVCLGIIICCGGLAGGEAIDCLEFSPGCAAPLSNSTSNTLSLRDVENGYKNACSIPSDIVEHVPVLADLAAGCSAVVEIGVRSGVSTWGMLMGLARAAANGTTNLTLRGFDLDPSPPVYTAAAAGISDFPSAINVTFQQADVLSLPPITADLLFIDTLHVYGQLKRELALHSGGVRKYIVLHDTTVDGELGEIVRYFDLGMTAPKRSSTPTILVLCTVV